TGRGTGNLIGWLADLGPFSAAAVISIPFGLMGTAIVGTIAGSAMRRSARQLMDVLDNMSQALCVVDSSGRLVFWNQQYVQMCKLSPDRLWAGRPLRDLLEERRPLGSFDGDADKYI